MTSAQPMVPSLLSRRVWLPALLLVLLTACQGEPASPDASPETAPDPEVAQTFGATVDLSAAISVADLRGAPGRYDSTQVTVRGRISEVCQMKGCWLALDAGEARPVRVLVPRLDDGRYGFTVPTSAHGEAIVTGTVRTATLNDATRDHYADDGATRPAATEIQIAADGIALLSASN